VRDEQRITAAEAAVFDAATRVVDADPRRYPHLSSAVNALHQERQGEVSTEDFNARMLALAATSRPADVLRRSGWSVHELMFTLGPVDVLDIRNAGMHTCVVWYLTCEQFGVEPPWAADLLRERLFCEQLDHERNRLRLTVAGLRETARA
jgi:hypothetical protein